MVGRAAAVLLLMLAAASLAHAGETAWQILHRQRALEEGERHWNDRYEQLQMDTVDSAQAARRMTLDLFDKKFPGREQRTMGYFSAPVNVKGTAFFAIEHPNRLADQWLFLPDAERPRLVGREARKRDFLGTGLSYADLDLIAQLVSWTEADADASLRSEEAIDGVRCHVIELTPKREEVGYQRIVLWVGCDDLVARQLEFYGTAPSGWFGFGGSAAASAPTRRIRQSELRMIGTIPVPLHAEVETPDSGSKTTIRFTHVAFDQDLPDNLFSQSAMTWGSFRPLAK